MSDKFRNKDGGLVLIKENPYNNEKVRDPMELIEFQQSKSLSTPYVESWAFITREYSHDGGGVRSICRDKQHFETEAKAINYLYDRGWVRGNSSTAFKRSNVTNGWSASEEARITCEIIKLKAW